MQIFGSAELKADVLDRDLCAGCGACVSLCPYFKSHRGKTAMLFPCTSPGGRCFAYCPRVEVDLDEISRNLYGGAYSTGPIGVYRQVKAARAGKKMTGAGFQAGGTVSAIMKYSLEKKHINAAVLTGRDGLLPVPRVVTEAAEVVKYASSKYTAAPTLSAFNEAVKDGMTKIGVVVTPCQAMALAQMRANPTGIENFSDPTALVVGLFCTWALDYRDFEAFIKGKVDIGRVTKFDIPPPPAEVMEIYLGKEKIEIPLSEVREKVPNACSYCFDMTAEFADISVGVLEGRADMNTLVVRSERGQAVVDAAVKDGYLALEELPEGSLEHLKTAALNKKTRALKKANGEGMINVNEEGKRSYFRMDGDTVERLAGR